MSIVFGSAPVSGPSGPFSICTYFRIICIKYPDGSILTFGARLDKFSLERGVVVDEHSSFSGHVRYVPDDTVRVSLNGQVVRSWDEAVDLGEVMRDVEALPQSVKQLDAATDG